MIGASHIMRIVRSIRANRATVIKPSNLQSDDRSAIRLCIRESLVRAKNAEDRTQAAMLASGAQGALALVSFGQLAEEGPEWGLPVSPDEVVVGRLTRRNP